MSSADNLCKHFAVNVSPDLDPNSLIVYMYLEEFFEIFFLKKVKHGK